MDYCRLSQKVRRLITVLLIICTLTSGYGNNNLSFDAIFNNQTFVNKSLNIGYFEMFFEDQFGRIWGGSDWRGLMMYNGETFVGKIQGPLCNRNIHCCIHVGGDYYLIGANTGLFEFDIRTLNYHQIEMMANDDVRRIIKYDDNTVLCFSDKRLVKYDTKNHKVNNLAEWGSGMLETVIPYNDNNYLIMTPYDGFYTYRYPEKQLRKLDITGLHQDPDEIMLCCVRDGDNVWVGSNKRLYTFNTQQLRIFPVKELEGKTIKTLCLDNDRQLWVGTNNGLMILDCLHGKWEHFTHRIDSPTSILNDCVWSIYQDKRGNMWIGVDAGLSFVPKGRKTARVDWNWDKIQNKGNRITHIFLDSYGKHWFGGINGLSIHDVALHKTYLFDKFGSNPIPDNTIRCIYEDSEGVIWIGTDGGISYFNGVEHKFENVNVVDAASGRNALWTYGFAEDGQGRMWIATCSGGVFCVDREKLIQGKGKTVEALCNYSSGNNNRHYVPSNSCTSIKKTSNGDIWIHANNFIYYFAAHEINGKQFPNQPQIIRRNNIVPLYQDGDSVLGYNKDSLIIAYKGKVELLPLEGITMQNGDVTGITADKERIWLLTDRRVFAMDRNTKVLRSVLDLADSQYKCIYYDKVNRQIWLGGTDHCQVFDPVEGLQKRTDIDNHAIISEIYVNNEPLTPSTILNGKNIITEDVAFCDKIVLGTDENSLAFRFSTGAIYRGTEYQTGYYYRMRGLSDTWIPIRPDNDLIEFQYMHYGNYQLEIGINNDDGTEIKNARTISIRIKTPWYLSWWFFLIMLLIVVGAIAAIFNHYRLRHKYRLAELGRKQAAELSQMKMDFITDMSHELKTPLTLILGSVNKLLSTVKSSPTRTEIQAVEKNVRKMGVVISHILNYKEYTGEANLTLTTIELVEFAKSITDGFTGYCEERQIKLDFCSSTDRLYVEVDPLKMESVLTNLLSNATKFTKAGGNIKVDICQQGGEHVLLKVSDTGMGIVPEDLPRIFERFYQSPFNQKENKDGSGIGLYTVKNYIKEMGGSIVATSELGKGTAFEILLPRKEYAEAKTPDADIQNDNKAIRVLIVEDNLNIAQYLTDGLKGMVCDTAHNGKAGMAKAIEMQPDIIIADIMMPLMDGETMSKQLKKNLSTRHIPIILLTAKDDKRTEMEAYKIGVDAFLSKPFDIKELRIRIEQLVGTRRTLNSNKNDVISTEENILPKTPQSKSADEMFVEEITSTIEKYIDDESLNVKRLAELMGINEKQLYRKTKLLVGMTVVDYIKSIRLKKAAYLLQQSTFTVKEVMYMVGFSSQSYFAKCFEEKYGKTPKEYSESVKL